MHTIRGKLSLAFLLIIAVCLIPTSAAAAYVIRYYQQQDAIERLSSFGQTVAGAASARQFSQFTPAEIVNIFRFFLSDGERYTRLTTHWRGKSNQAR